MMSRDALSDFRGVVLTKEFPLCGICLLGGSSQLVNGCKWFISMMIATPLSRVVGPLPNGRTLWLGINGGYLVTY